MKPIPIRTGQNGMPARRASQRGVVLFFTLIALVIMSLAAVALIRSVDTGTMIAGNLSFRQGASASADTGIEAAIAWMGNTTQTMREASKNILTDFDYALNKTGGVGGYTDDSGNACCLNKGYYSNIDPNLSLTDGSGIQWDNSDSTLVLIGGNTVDVAGNEIRYVIQRMCRTADKLPHRNEDVPNNQTGCLMSSAMLDNWGKQIPYATQVCNGGGCPTLGETAMMRITARVKGPKNTISYIQTIVY